MEAWLLVKVRAKVETGRTGGEMEEGWDGRWRANGKGKKIWEDGRNVGHIVMQLVTAGLIQWGDYTEGGEWMGWERAKGKHELGVQCKVRYEATLAEIRGHEGVREWKEGWVKAQMENEVWEGTMRKVTAARRVPQCMGSWEYKVEWEGETRAIWELAETLVGTDAEIQQQMKKAKDEPEHASMYERVEADREGLEKVLAGRASCEEDREDDCHSLNYITRRQFGQNTRHNTHSPQLPSPGIIVYCADIYVDSYVDAFQ